MKKLFSMMLIMASFVCFTACSEEENPPTYSIRCDVVNGYSQTLRIFECNASGDKIYDHIIADVDKGKTYTFTAFSPDVTKIKIHISVESSFYDYAKWVQRVYYLNGDKTTSIVLTSSTIIGPDEP